MASVKTRIVKVCPHCGKSYAHSDTHVCAQTPPDGSRRGAADPLIGAMLGERYEILERLSQGGMGVVYRARHAVLKRVVAVKIMLKKQDEATQERFLLEAQIASTLNHPNIVYISDFGVLDDGRSYIVMEFLQGQTLSSVLRHGRLSPLRSCRIGAQIADGLQVVHEKGIVHRDLKPDNILLLSRVSQAGREDFVKILDFGIALAGDQRTATDSRGSGEVGQLTGAAAELALQKRYTVPGMVMGTPAYMSPEQAQGETLDGRSDQYALGCVLYEMLSGAVPFNDRRNVAKVLMGHISGRVVPLTDRVPDVPESLDQLVRQLLAKRPEDRFASMSEVGQALALELKSLSLDNVAESRDPSASLASAALARRTGRLAARRRRLLLVMVPLGVVLLASAGYVGYRQLRPPPDHAQMTRELVELRQRAISELKAQLQNPDSELRLRAITSIGQTHEAALRPLLEALLQEHDPIVQLRAAEALGQLGDRGARPALRVIAEKTKSSAVRVAAAGALDQLGDALSQKLLHNELMSNDQEARVNAARVLCSASEVEAQAVLREWLGRGNPPDGMFVSTLYRLASAGDYLARSQLLSRLERGGRPEVQLAAAASLAKLGEERGRQVLFEASRRPDQEQVLAARLYASIDSTADLELFRRILENRDASPAALIAAVDGLGDAGQSNDALALAGFLGHKDPRLRQTAASAIIELTGRDPATLSDQSLAWAEGALLDSNVLIRSSAVATLGDAGSRALPVLKRVLTSDAEPLIRRAAARALARHSDKATLVALRVGLADPNTDVRKETMRAIARVGQQQLGDTKVITEVKAWLTPLLNSTSRDEQVLASGTLYRLGDESQRARLTAWLKEPDPATRRAALNELSRDRELLALVMQDAEPAVRLTAARKLAELGDKRALAILTQAVNGGGLDGLAAYALLRRLGVVIGAPRDSDALRFNRDVKIRRAALEALMQLPIGELRPVLLAAAHDGSSELRLSAAELAAELPVGTDSLPGGVPVLRALLYDNDTAVRMRASALLSRLLRPLVEREIAAGTTRGVRPAVSRPPASTSPTPRPVADAGVVAGLSSPPDAGVPVDADAHPDGGAVDLGAGEGGRTADPTRVPDIIADQFLESGVDALQHKDYKKAQKLLERASSLCAKKGKRSKECAQLGPEIAYQLGSTYEAQDQLASAAAEYQKIEAANHGKGDKQKVAQARTALARLSARLGRIEISKLTGRHCVHGTMWMEPGLHRITLGNGQSTTVKVEAHQTVELKTCSAKAPG